MSRRKKRKNGTVMKRGSGGFRIFCEAALCVVIIGGIGYTAFKIVTGLTEVKDPATGDIYVETTTAEKETMPPSPYEFIYEQHSNEEICNGDLILVNNDTEYKAQGKEELVSIFDEKNLIHAEGDNAFGVTDSSLQLRKNAADKLVEMLDKFNEATGNDNVVVCSGYRTKETQQRLYDEDLENTGDDNSTRVAKPGFSEHESGYAVDLTLYDGEYDGTGEYEWINKNCAAYGYILRYKSEKSDLTQIQDEPWHYRYVGTPHAEYIMQNNLCLEEYIDLLKNSYAYTESSIDLLEMEGHDGERYAVYYFAADTSADSTYLPIPADKEYTVSGNNQDGFVVSFCIGEKSAETQTASAAQS